MVGRVGSLALLAVLAAAGGTGGCGDDSSSTTDDGGGADADAGDGDAGADADGDGDADAEDGGPTGSLGVLVLGTQPLFTGTEWPPLAGAAVALDLPGGGRREAATDAAGRTSFSGLDWSAGRAAVTAWAEGYGLASIVDLDGTDSEVTLVLPTVADPFEGFVDLTIDFSNVSVSASTVGAGTFDQWRDDPFGSPWAVTIGIAPDRTFALVASDRGAYTGLPGGFDQPTYDIVARQEGPCSAAATIDVDFASALATTTVHGSFALPARADSPLRTGIGGWSRCCRGFRTREPSSFRCSARAWGGRRTSRPAGTGTTSSTT